MSGITEQVQSLSTHLIPMNLSPRSSWPLLLWSFLVTFMMPSALFAHHAEWMKDKPFIQGLSMPVHGLDHLLVTFAVGLIAVQIGGYALLGISAAVCIM